MPTNLQIAPRYLIYVGDTELKSDITDRIINVEVDLDIDMADEITITVDDRDRKMSESKVFAEGNLVHVFGGYGNQLEHLSSGEVTVWLPDYPREGAPTLQIKAHDASHKYMDRQKHKGGTFRKKKDSEIAHHLITDHMSMSADVDPTEGLRARLQKKGVTDYKYLKRLALINGYYCWVEYDTEKNRWIGYWKTKESVRTSQELVYSFVYNNDLAVSLLSFRPEFATRGQNTEVEVVSYDTKLKKTIKQVVREEKKGPEPKFTDVDPLEDEIVSGASVTFTAFGDRLEIISHKPFKSKDEAQKFAERYLKARSENFLTGEGEVVGTPGLRPRQVHYLGGMGARLSGQWEFTHCRHAFPADGGYETGIKARKVFDPANPKSGVADVPIVPRLATYSQVSSELAAAKGLI